MAGRKHKKKTWFSKLWYFLWEDDSLLSWIVNFVLAFVIIKFLLYPGLGFALQTNHPIVAVVSGSMEHGISEGILCGKTFDNKGTVSFDDYWQVCGNWYEDNNITKKIFAKFPFKNGFWKGDIMVLYGTKINDVEVGDVIVFIDAAARPIIHRVVAIKTSPDNNNEIIFQTKGDHNVGQLVPPASKTINERKVLSSAYVGKAVFRVPLLGYVKIIAVDALRLVLGVFH
jgi:signal peptidase I